MQPVNTPYAELVGDGSSTEIEFDFSVDIASTSPSGAQSYPRVRLITYDEYTGALESVETLTYGTDYTVALTAKDSEAGDLAYPGGTITLTVAPEDYQTVYVDRVSPLTQSTIFPTGGQLNLRTLEAKLDYLTRIAQEQGLDISRIPVSDDPTAEPVLWYATEDDWGKYASLDLSGNAVFVTEVTPGNLTLTNQGDGRVCYFGATDEIRGDERFTFDEDTNTLGVENILCTALTASRVVVTDGDKKLSSSATTAAQIGYLSTITGDVQTQLNARLPLAGGTMTGDLVLAGNPDLALEAATKQYVDGPKASGTRKACRVYQSSAQTVSAGGTEDITWDSESFDTAGMHDTGSNTDRLTVVDAGLYQLNACINWLNPGAGTYVMRIKKNGSNIAIIEKSVAGSFDETMQLTVLDVATAGQYYVVEVSNLTAGAEDVRGGSGYSYFEAVLLDQ